MPVTLWTPETAGAPYVTGQAGSLLTVLDNVLLNRLGWTKPYANSGNVGCYVPSGETWGLVVNDNAPHATALGREARVVGYEVVTSATGGTNPFPTPSQDSGFLVVRKSNTADTVSRSWVIVGDDKTFYMGIQTGDFAGGYWFVWGFGKYDATNNPTWPLFLAARRGENSTSIVSGLTSMVAPVAQTGTVNGLYLVREAASTVGAVPANAAGDAWKGQSTGLYGVLRETPVDNCLWRSRVQIVQGSTSLVPVLQGAFRFLWYLLHPYNRFASGARLALPLDSGGGTELYCLQPVRSGSDNGALFFELPL